MVELVVVVEGMLGVVDEVVVVLVLLAGVVGEPYVPVFDEAGGLLVP